MRDSGVEWLGEIPAHWNVTRIKYAAQLSPTCDIKRLNSDAMITFTPMECIHDGYFDNKSVPLSSIKGTYTPYAEGDIVLAKVTPCFENGNISVMEELASGYGLGSSELFVLRPYAINKWYLFYYLRNEQFIQRACANMTGTGGLKRIPSTFIQNYPLLLPSPEEQESISKYLNDKCAQIDSLISEVESTIKEYVNWKSSIIYEAVTKGLNPNVEMKESGVEYLGKVVSSWNIVRLKFLLSTPLQYGANEAGLTYDKQLPRYIRITDISLDGQLKTVGMQSVSEEVAQKYLLDEGDILLARSGATAGKSFYYKSEYGRSAFAGYLIRAKINPDKALPKYIYYTTLGAGYDMWRSSTLIQSTIQNISAARYNEYVIALPSIPEQRKIVGFLDKICSSIDDLIAEKNALIAELESYKKSLIFEVVTGKRKVV